MAAKNLKEAAECVLAIQDASNLQPVIRTWAEAQTFVREDRDHQGPWERHPINILYMSKVASLMGVNSTCIGGVERMDADLFSGAYTVCKQMAGKG